MTYPSLGICQDCAHRKVAITDRDTIYCTIRRGDSLNRQSCHKYEPQEPQPWWTHPNAIEGDKDGDQGSPTKT